MPDIEQLQRLSFEWLKPVAWPWDTPHTMIREYFGESVPSRYYLANKITRRYH